MSALQVNVGVQNQTPTAQGIISAGDRQGAVMVSEMNSRYSALSRAGMLFMANAIVTAPVIYTTAAGTGGPLLWNPPGSGVVSQILAVGFGITVVTTVAAALGITGGSGQVVAPTSTTAIDSSGPLSIGGAVAKTNAYRIGTPSAAGTFFLPFGNLDTGALTTSFGGMNWTWLDGLVTIPQGCWAAIAASATASTTVGNFALVWAEVPA